MTRNILTNLKLFKNKEIGQLIQNRVLNSLILAPKRLRNLAHKVIIAIPNTFSPKVRLKQKIMEVSQWLNQD